MDNEAVFARYQPLRIGDRREVEQRRLHSAPHDTYVSEKYIERWQYQRKAKSEQAEQRQTRENE